MTTTWAPPSQVIYDAAIENELRQMMALEDLDVPIPCTMRLPGGVECPGASTWILYLRPHDCGKRPIVTHTICTLHYEKLTSGVLVGRCNVCHEWAKMLDYVLRLEPLNSKGNRQ